MKVKVLYAAMKGGLQSIPRRDRYFAFGVAALMVILHFTSMAPIFYQSDLPILRVLFVPWMLLIIGAMILISSIGLWSRTFIGFVFSLFALCGVQAAYFVWFLNSRSVMAGHRRLEFFRLNPEYLPNGAFGLIGAQRLNIAVLGIAFALFVWQTKTLVSVWRLR